MRFVRLGTRPPDILLISPTFAENIDSDGYHDLKSETVEPENTGDVVPKRQDGYKRMYQDIVGKLARAFVRNKRSCDLRR